MLCPTCVRNYTYSEVMIGGHPGNERVQGWVRKEVLQKAQGRERAILAAARERYYQEWHDRVVAARTKRQVWTLLTANGAFSPALGTFYSHTKGLRGEDLVAYAEQYFTFGNLRQLFRGAGIDADWEALGVRAGPCELCGGPMSLVLFGELCSQCRYLRRPA
jgi:hypothetical protein